MVGEFFIKNKDFLFYFVKKGVGNVHQKIRRNPFLNFEKEENGLSKMGSFEVYSSADGKIKHYQQMNIIWYMLALIFVGPGLMTLFELIFNQITEVDTSTIMLDLILFLFGLFFFKQSRPLSKKIKALKED